MISRQILEIPESISKTELKNLPINLSLNYRKALHRMLLMPVFLLVCLGTFAFSQTTTLSLDTCYALAQINYPLVMQMDLLEQSKEYSLSNASKGYLPQVNIGGQASYQSEVTSFPGAGPNSGFPELSKDQYKIYGEINQPLTEVFVIKQQKALIEGGNIEEKQKLQVELYALKERINQIYFGILIIDSQLKQIEILQSDINAGIRNAKEALENGTGIKSNVDILQAELLKSQQRTSELKATRRGFAGMLSLFVGQEVDEATILETPPQQPIVDNIQRPELALFDVMQRTIDSQDKLITAKNLPRLGLFLQGGYARPALNFLDDHFDFYYIFGVRLNYNLSGLYTIGKERKQVDLNRGLIRIQKETFIFNTRLKLHQQKSELQKLQELISADEEIIILRQNILVVSKSQLENGTISANDYITHANALDLASQNLSLHRLQFLLAQYSHLITSGN